MKKEQIPFIGSLFGGRKVESLKEQKQSTPVMITSYSQSDVLQQRMREEKLSHGETVTANLEPVRLERYQGKVIMYFCPMRKLEILETLNKGDGGNIPRYAKVEGLNIPDDLKPGFYSLKNVQLTSNGTMQVKATPSTVWEHSPVSDFTSAVRRDRHFIVYTPVE